MAGLESGAALSMDSGTLFGLLLVGLTAGTVVYLFLLILVLGHRHKTAFERLLFFVFLVMFLHQSGLLLYLNTLIEPLERDAAVRFVVCVSYAAMLFLPPLLVHLHLQYFRTLRVARRSPWLAVAIAFYAAVPLWLFTGMRRIWNSGDPASAPDFGPHVMLALSFLVASLLQGQFARAQGRDGARGFHGLLCVFFAAAAAALAVLTASGRFDWRTDPAAAFLLVSPALPGAITAYFVLRRSFSQLGVQRNLAFAATGGFLAVLYLTLVSRASMWLAPYFPPIATVSTLVFLLVFLFEPLQRWLSGALHRLFRVEAERVQRLMAEIQQRAYGGNGEDLLRFAEDRIKNELQLTTAAIIVPGRSREMPSGGVGFAMSRPVAAGGIHDPAEPVQMLWVSYAGAILSGETRATLEALALQLPSAIDLCRAIEEKLKLERELAERERFAMLGQMAASISHNLKNPLGSMKTLLQLQLETPSLPEQMRRDCELVVAEIDRMSAKLHQLLHFARPAVRAGAHETALDATALVTRLLDLIRRDAAQRGIALLFERPPGELPVRAPEDALTDIFQNIIVNAVEASARRGTVKVALEQNGTRAVFAVTDDGPGIPPDVQARIFHPFFTTKPAGTGLGLAIVQRRLGEIGGAIECVSPVAGERGTRFIVKLP